MKLSRKHFLMCLGILALVQFGIGIGYILSLENTFQKGQEFKFKCTSLNAFDILHGKFILLKNDEIVHFIKKESPQYDEFDTMEGKLVTVEFERNENGFAKIKNMGTAVDKNSPNTLKLKIYGVRESKKKGGKFLRLEPTFEKYFLNEEASIDFDKYLIRDNESIKDISISVKIYKNKYTVTQLFIGDKKLADFLREYKNPNKNPSKEQHNN